MTVILLINPHAGKQTVLQEIDEIEKVFLETGAKVITLKTEDQEQARQLVYREGGADLLVCCGGDGTLSSTVNEVLKVKATLPLGYIPSGSTNDFASTLGLSKNFTESAQAIVSKPPRPIDVGRFEDQYFIYVASFGAFTQSSYTAPQSLKNSLGHFAYVIEGIKELPQLKAYRVKVETDEDVLEGEYLFGAVSNSTSLGGMVRIDPKEMALDDGVFELILVKNPQSLLELHKIIASLKTGNFDPEVITFLHTSRAVFHCEDPMPWSLDGEYAPGKEKIEITVQPQAIRLCC